MKVTNISAQIWIIIMGILGLFFFTCILSFRSLYNQSLEQNYIHEFERTIQEIEHFAETDPELFLDQLDSINKAVSHVEYRVFLDEDLASQVNLDEDLTPFQEKVVEDPDVLSSLRTRDNTQVVKTIRQENQIDTPFIMRLYKFEAAGEEMLLV